MGMGIRLEMGMGIRLWPGMRGRRGGDKIEECLKSESTSRLYNVLLHNAFYGRPCNFHNGLIKLSCILCLEGRVSRAESDESGAKNK